MNYCQCSIEELQFELRRRGYNFIGTRDQLGEALKKDDDARGSEATTVTTKVWGPFVPRDLNSSRTAEFGKTAVTSVLVDERVVYWTMNTFFSTLQLFFDSGRSCTIDGNCVPHTVIGLDPALRFRLTDCTHEEDGRILRSLRPDKFAHTAHGIRIREATIAQRTSVVMRSEGSGSNGALPPLGGGVTLTQEVHTVVGLKLDGMNKMAYVWARSVDSSIGENRKWGDVRPTGLRDDVPAPYLGFPMHLIKPGGEVAVFSKVRQVNENLSLDRDKSNILRRTKVVVARV